MDRKCLENPRDRGAWRATAHKVAQTWIQLKRLSLHACTGEGNGSPLQCSCLKNPRDRGAWWAATYGVAQSRTRWKWLSSSSSLSQRLTRKSHSQAIPAPWSKLNPWRPPSKHQPYRAVRSSQVTLCFLTPQQHGTHLSICLQTHLCPQSLCRLLHLADFCSSLRQGSPSPLGNCSWLWKRPLVDPPKFSLPILPSKGSSVQLTATELTTIFPSLPAGAMGSGAGQPVWAEVTWRCLFQEALRKGGSHPFQGLGNGSSSTRAQEQGGQQDRKRKGVRASVTVGSLHVSQRRGGNLRAHHHLSVQSTCVAFSGHWTKPSCFRGPATGSTRRSKIRVATSTDPGHRFKPPKTGGKQSGAWAIPRAGGRRPEPPPPSTPAPPCFPDTSLEERGPYLWRRCRLHRKNRRGSLRKPTGKRTVPTTAALLHAESF